MVTNGAIKCLQGKYSPTSPIEKKKGEETKQKAIGSTC